MLLTSYITAREQLGAVLDPQLIHSRLQVRCAKTGLGEGADLDRPSFLTSDSSGVTTASGLLKKPPT